MIDHLSLGVADVPRARAFYDAVLGKLGYRRVYDHDDDAAAYGESFPMFWVVAPLDDRRPASAGNGAHICFQAPSRTAVDAFHAEALRRDGRDGGAPGRRPEYGESYYGAFVFDPDDNKIGAVCYHAE